MQHISQLPMSFLPLCTFTLAALLSYWIGLVVYRLLFHPLAKYPGSKWAAATGWYEFYFDVLKRPGGAFMYEIEKMHEKYGPIVRINPDEVHVKDHKWFTDLYCGPGSGIRNKPASVANMINAPLSSLGTAHHDQHRKRRAAYSPYFSKAAIVGAEPTIHSYMDILGQKLEKAMEENNAVELRTLYLAIASDAFFTHAFKKPLDYAKDDQAAETWRRTVDSTAAMTPLAKQFDWAYPLAMKLPESWLKRLSPDMAQILALRSKVNDQAAIAIQKHNSRPSTDLPKHSPASDDMFQTILNSNLPPEEKTQERLAQEGFTIHLGGGGTTAHILVNATYHLLANKDTALAKLKEELATAMVDPNIKLEVKVLEKLPYLAAVVKESLRISGLITSRAPLISPKEPLTYGEWQIPAGTPISMTQRDLLLDPSIFPEPMYFRPERWLQAGPELEEMNQAFVPFSRGSRMCPGMNFALSELYIMIACVFRRYELELYDTIRERDIDVVRDCFLGEASLESTGVRVKVVGVSDGVLAN